MKILISILLIIHGLIVAGQAVGSFGSTIPNEIQNPSFVSWWPVNMGRSWLFSWLGLDKTLVVYRIGGLLWLAGGIALVAAGLGALGFVIPTAWWRDLAVAGGAISLLMLAIYLHPLLIIGTASSVAVLAVLLWSKWPLASLIRW
ncbi:MAG TPA: hypothetical protein VK897_20800 [Anaerolineales bacterium]|nr:hypothetical protein [Anaerolineales bacterium]